MFNGSAVDVAASGVESSELSAALRCVSPAVCSTQRLLCTAPRNSFTGPSLNGSSVCLPSCLSVAAVG